MDVNVKHLVSEKSSSIDEKYNFFTAPLYTKTGMFGNVKDEPDALDAVKLDPAVLEAQVTVHTKEQTKDSNTTDAPRNSGSEKSNEKVTTSETVRGFEDMISQHEAALLSLRPNQLELLMKYADMLRRQRIVNQKHSECAFCKKNGTRPLWYTSHMLRDGQGRVQCPILRRYRCPRCGATGDHAHTIKYCYENYLSEDREPHSVAEEECWTRRGLSGAALCGSLSSKFRYAVTSGHRF